MKEKRTVALMGNPNVGKSTLFNQLTGMHQHTGNWPGKTVADARGICESDQFAYTLVDLPGTYSLMAHSPEEEVARDYIKAGQADGIVVVCDGTCLERNLFLVLQILELSGNLLVCVNLMDEAERKGIQIDGELLAERLGVPVVLTEGRKKKGAKALLGAMDRLMNAPATNKRPERDAKMLVEEAQTIAAAVVTAPENPHHRDRRIDRLFTGKWTAYPLMLLLLAGVLWLTIEGANYPSAWLSRGLFWVQDRLSDLFVYWGAPDWLHGMLVLGCYRTLAWVVAVMLPPMAIFFPLFTLLEDMGFLPRVAYNLDRPFAKCHACGKQALTMCMGFGCNAAGVTGCRIIDSPRERLIAILTNNFVPCNGRFPTLITLITLFLAGGSLFASLGLTAAILLGILMTFWISRLLSHTLLKGEPSSFTLELPPYRKPQVGRVLLRSVLDRTLFVLGRAAAVAAPFGILLWILGNVTVGEVSLLNHVAAFLDPLGRLMGMDGVILTAFILGFPANEIVIPVMMMGYLSQGVLTDFSSLAELGRLLEQQGWTWVTAVCTVLFSLMHWPCSTTMLTIYKETKSKKWTFAAFWIPTLCGILLCFLTATISRLFF